MLLPPCPQPRSPLVLLLVVVLGLIWWSEDENGDEKDYERVAIYDEHQARMEKLFHRGLGCKDKVGLRCKPKGGTREAGWGVKVRAEHGSEKPALGVEKWLENPRHKRTIMEKAG